MRRAARLTLALLTVLLIPAAGARADVFGPISLVSADALEQADFAHDPAIASGGRYVVFDGSVGNVTGVWRRDLETGELQQVAGGDAQLPSISADGRWVSFTTNEGGELAAITNDQPDPTHSTGEAPNVYVRDMSVGPQAEGAFTIVSAPSHSSTPLSYETTGSPEKFGAVAAGRSAISADGSEVVFVTTAVSDLTRYPAVEAEEAEHAEGPRPHTPALQVAVRDLPTRTTRLVSVRRDATSGAPALDPETGEPEPVPAVGEGGRLYGAVSTQTGIPAFEPIEAYEMNQHIGASISADGNAVAWMGSQLAAQVPMLSGEALEPNYTAPLWRRIGDGEAAPTRQVTGGADPESAACVASGETRLPGHAVAGDPCQGPFETQRTVGDPGDDGLWLPAPTDNDVPQLSGDGYTVVFLSNVPLAALLNEEHEDKTDVFVADMHPGVSRAAALLALTQRASSDETALATNAPIIDVSISPNASLSERRGQIAFTTDRTVFPLGIPADVSTRLAQPGMGEVYDVDLGNDTLTRVTHGYEGGPSEQPYNREKPGLEDPFFTNLGADDGALSPSFTAEGNMLAFASTANNLSFGDDNTPKDLTKGRQDGSDAFVVERVVFPPQPVENNIAAPPSNPLASVPWALKVTAQSLREGRVRLYVEIPASGTLRAAASGSVPSHAKPKHPTKGRPASVRRTVASLGAPVKSGFAVVTLTLTKAYRSLASRNDGVGATVSLVFAAPGHPALRTRVNVRFRAQKKTSVR